MGKSKLDQLFQERLGDMEISPSIEAKQVVYDHMSYRRRVGLLKKFGIAASVIIIIGAGFIGFNQLIEETPRIALEESFPTFENELTSIIDIENNHISVPLARMDQSIEIAEKDEVESESKINNNAPTEVVEPANSEPTVILAEADTDQGKMNMNAEIEDIENSIAGENSKEGRLIEYSIVEPHNNQDVQVASNEPMIITIEYKSSGNKSNNDSKIKQLYSKIGNMKPADEVFGDLRTLKDKVFAFNFKKENKIENQKNVE